MSSDLMMHNDKIDKLSCKFNQSEWVAIEKKMNNFELKVLECLILLGTSSNYEVKQEYTVLGEELYLANRDLLKKPMEFVFDIQQQEIKKSKKKEIINSKTKLILENAKLRSKSQIETVLKTFTGDFQPKYSFNSDIIEIKGIGLLYSGWYLFTNNLQYRKKKHLLFVFTIMVAIERFINNCQNFEGKNLINGRENVSTTLLNDLQIWLDKLKTIYTYNGFAIYDHAPELLIYTDYDKAVPSIGIKPRKHQIDMINIMKENNETGYIIAYNPLMGSGKTTSIVAIANYIQIIRKDVKYKNTVLIFACNLIPVKNHAASLCYNAGIKFGMGWKNMVTGKYEITNHFSCANSEERIVIITSPEVAYDILNDHITDNNSDRYILFLDEPTIGADDINSETLQTNMSVLSIAPKRTILSSATFPDMELIPDIINHTKQKYPSIVLKTVYSNDIQIGCDVKTFDHHLVVPHLGITTAVQLKNVIDIINKCPFLGRIYTSNVVRTLWEIMKLNNVSNVPDISKIFDNVDNMNANKVREIAMDLLNILCQCNDTIVKNICSSNIFENKIILNNIDSEKNTIKKEKKDSIWEEDQEEEQEEQNTNNIEYTKLATTQAWLMQNTTLIATPTPIQFVKDNFNNIVQDIYNVPSYKNTKSILKIYERELEITEKRKEIFEKSIEQASKKKKSQSQSDDTRDKLTKDDIEQKIQDYDNAKPSIKFPNFGHINSMEHIKKYAKSHANKLIGKTIRTPSALESIPYNTFNITDELLTLLFAGVGIYSTIDKTLCPNYLACVLNMASNGDLAYIVADVSICYGTNYPINRVIVTDEFADQHSINTLFQLLGRAGRVGRSWVAEAYMSSRIAQKLIAYTRNMPDNMIEPNNMIHVFNHYINNKIIINNVELNNILAKYIVNDNDKILIKNNDPQLIKIKNNNTLLFQKYSNQIPIPNDYIIVPNIQQTAKEHDLREYKQKIKVKSHYDNTNEIQQDQQPHVQQPHVQQQERTYNRPQEQLQERTYNKLYNRPQEQQQERTYNKPYNRPQDQLHERTYNKPYNRPQDQPQERTYNKPYNRPQDQPQERTYNKLYNRPQDQPYERTYNRPYNRPQEQLQERTYNKPYNRLQEQLQERTYNRPQEQQPQEEQVPKKPRESSWAKPINLSQSVPQNDNQDKLNWRRTY